MAAWEAMAKPHTFIHNTCRTWDTAIIINSKLEAQNLETWCCEHAVMARFSNGGQRWSVTSAQLPHAWGRPEEALERYAKACSEIKEIMQHGARTTMLGGADANCEPFRVRDWGEHD